MQKDKNEANRVNLNMVKRVKVALVILEIHTGFSEIKL